MARVIVITSGKGGVGKTTTTSNIGMALAGLGYNTLLVDADVGLRNLDLLLGLGSVALLVGGVAIANVMVMSVLERRMEIGVRRSIGATRREIRYQFLLESIVLSGIGGLVGVFLGTGITLGYTNYTNIVFSIPVWQIFGAVLLALLIGAISGVYPAIKASKIQPAEAVRK